MGAAPVDAASGILLLSAQSGFSDEWSKAAASAAAAANPGTILQAMMATDGSASAQFARGLAASLAASADEAARLAVVKAASSAKNLEVAKVVLRELALSKAPAPADHAAGLSALAAVLNVKELAPSAAPLAATWVKGDELHAELAAVAATLLPQLADAKAPASVRVQALQSLIGLRRYDAAIVPAVGTLIAKGADDSAALAAAEALSATGEEASGKALLAGFIRSEGSVRKAAYAGLMTRPDWAGLVLGALEEKAFSPMQLSTLQSSQLLRHPDEAIAKRSAAVFAKLNVGTSPAKDDLINKLRPEVEKPGDIAKGKELFAGVCSTCHRLGDVGYDFGPNLAGIGSHPAAELLVHIVDPSRMVDDEHRTWNIKLKDGTLYSALIASENTAVLKLKQPAGIVIEVKVADIASRQRVATSLMPEGFEALGPEGLRNLIAYIRSTAASGVATAVGRFRLLDLGGVFTASTNTGLYANKDAKRDTLPFAKFGQVESNGVPYQVVDPKNSKDGLNVIVLKGGNGKGAYSKSFAQKVEIPVGSVANRIHFLGAVGGWGAHDAVAMIAEVHFLSGKVQKKTFYGARDFADYNGTGDVPGSKSARQLLVGEGRQVRTLWIPVESDEIIDKLVLSSADTEIAPTTVAVTIEIGGPPNPPRSKDEDAPKAGKKGKGKANDGPSDLLPKDNPKTTHAYDQLFGPRKAGQLRVLFAGAGSSHNFPAFFLGTDAQTAKAAGYDVASTPNLKEALTLLPEADLFVFSGNHAQFGTPEFQKAIRDFAAAGKGIVLLHAATWYNWQLETKYNDEFVCGGARGHGHSDFPFTVTKPDHPVMKGVPATFVINDESYNVEFTRPEGAEILGTIPRQNPKEGQSKILPSVWTVKYPGTKVVCIALGHDEKSHDHPAYRQLLLNSLTWVSQK
jgi:putative heme-binding domain-containing protein